MLQNFLKNLNLTTNEATRIDCPICFNKKTFSALNTGNEVIYNCFHADCNIKGRTRNELSKKLFAEVEKQKEPEVFYYRNHWEERNTNKEYLNYVRQYNLEEHFNIMRYDRHTHRAVFLVNKEDKLIDAVGRALYKNKKPKWYRYGNSGYPFVAGKGDTAIIVEDVVSALVLCKYCVGIALLGTNLLQTHIDVLKKYKKVGIALDKDASKKAVKLVDDLSLNLNTKFLLLEEDIKEMIDEDIKKLVDKVDKKAWGWMNDTY
tara:strand:- start:154 stop:936 length:783 start_codon:yes stop_codon:yes gene_type:complete